MKDKKGEKKKALRKKKKKHRGFHGSGNGWSKNHFVGCGNRNGVVHNSP